LAVKKLRKNKTKKSKQKYILLLEESFEKAVDQDNRSIERYKKDTNPAVIENVYETYTALDKRQELIRPLLPLTINSKNRDAQFAFVNYTNEINAAKTSLSDYLYTNAQNLLNEKNKASARKAYDDLEYLQNINSNFKNTKSLLKEAVKNKFHVLLQRNFKISNRNKLFV
jgi:lipopolysaccharide biosynthesis regulator YciM